MEDWLRSQVPPATPHDLDRLKARARAQASGAPGAGRSHPRPRGLLATAFTVLALVGALGGAFALAGGGPPASPGSASSQGSAAVTQYKPGKGCGDKNHQHEREDECKKPPK